MLFDGEIVYHYQDSYPDDASKRTNQEDESVSQARRLARYHVYRERGYDTLPPIENPDRIAAVLLALLDLSDAQFAGYFQTLYEQAASHDRSDIVPPLELPSAVYNEEFLLYKQNIYLEEDLEAIQEQLTRPATEVLGEQDLEEVATATSEGLVSKATSLVGGGGESDGAGAALTIEGVSGIDTMYYEDTNEDRTIEGDDPFDRDPDARLEIVPTNYAQDRFRYHVGHNLVCQIRDCFIGMGLEPPEPYRVLGHGKYKYTGKYRHFDFYEPYFDHEADIDGYVAPG
ncbi:hypothetical protein [Natrinema gari]|uniref:Uncharacterized protein n=1 Tax=Natrinema gari JCM 14663 TaxID=1230459 RepID=L9YP00_9EURY|nr:hypothetical protein [Natrinema gari]ELY75401.1 hypothetical protein C486_19403 [Natrinema gari JCM 14663]